MVLPGRHQRQVHGRIGLRAGVRLHVDVGGAEQLLGAIDGQLLGDIDELAAAVVALARIPFGVLVGQHRALGFQDPGAGVVLRGDELDMVFLALLLAGNGVGELRIKTGDGHRLLKHSRYL